jgi:polar amino acid transport system substrate-binding protein
MTERKIDNQMQWLDAVSSNIGDGVVLTDKQGFVIYVNNIVKKIIQKEDKDIINKTNDNIIDELRKKLNDDSSCESAEHRLHEQHFSYTFNESINTKVCINMFINEVLDNKGETIGKVIIIPNVEECDKAHQIIHKMAHYDSLTGLANRALINEALEKILINAKENNTKAAVAFLDLDNFKLINDTMGHDAGDVMLRKISAIVKSCIDADDFAGRLGGDEFIIIMPEAEDMHKLLEKMNKLIQGISKPIHIKDKEFYITASIGIAYYPEHGEDVQEIIKNADTAMYSAKANGKNICHVFNGEMNIEALEKLELVNDLRNAVANNEFILHYQPQIDISNNEIIGMEALIRWQHPTKGLIPPLSFIPLAEETGMILPIGEWALREACLQSKQWQEEDRRPMKVAVNLSIVQFEHNNLVGIVKKILKETGLSPKLLEIEITESVALKCYDCAYNKIKELKDIGVNVSLDDFGTGYSSFNYLRQLPVDTLKIDKIFLDNLAPNSDEEFIMKTMIILAKRLNLRVVAEGVETLNQLEFLKKQKCDTAQGFLFSKPLPIGDFAKLISCVAAS